jgi:type VI protein secretion system component VasK
MGHVSDRHRRLRDVMIAGGVVAFFVLGLVAVGSGWPLAAVIVVLLGMVLNLATLCWLIWAMVTRRIGVTHWAPARQESRTRTRRRARAEAMAQQQRLDAALSHGPYRPEPQPAPPPGEQARARQELLEAAEQYGSLSPQARAAAEKVRRLSG